MTFMSMVDLHGQSSLSPTSASAPVQRAFFAPGGALEPVGQALGALSEGSVPVINLMCAALC